MTSPPPSVMSPEVFRLIKEFVAENFGLLLDDGKLNYLSTRLRAHLDDLKLTSFTEYYSYLKFSGARSREHARFISLITNNETYFFREKPQLDVFSQSILPALRNKKLGLGERKIRIVSAGCSSGEEVYTLAMLMLDSGYFAWDWDIRVIGVDVDREVLAKAELGVYSGRAFHATPEPFIDRYFKRSAEGFVVRDILRSMTGFVEGNLLSFAQAVSAPAPDIIFCRNVLIYFNEDTMKRIVDSFARILGGNGLLFLGHAESLARITDRFVPMRFPGAIIYKVRD